MRVAGPPVRAGEDVDVPVALDVADRDVCEALVVRTCSTNPPLPSL